MMGSNSGDDDEQPVHEVTVPGFEMTLNEVTVAQYAVCLGDGACTAPATTEDCNWDVTGRDDHPVNCLTWQQAADFCAWATGRLPSEAEWEYAARSEGRNIAYPWGNQNPNCDYAIIGNGCGEMGTWPVCSKNAGNTEQGLCDMVGNAQEWCQDCYHETYDNAPVDGSAWEDPDCTRRVIRGGSWYSFSLDSLLTTNRFRSFASSVNAYNGFRCTRASKESLKNYFPGR